MPEQNRAQSAFEQLRQDVQPFIQRPGVEAAQRTVRRRRVRSALLSVVVLACATVTAVSMLRHVPAQPAVEVTNSPSLTERSGSPDPSATVILPSTEPESSQQAQPGQPTQPQSVSPSVTTSPENFGCLKYPVGWPQYPASGTSNTVGFGSKDNNDPGWEMCSGVRLKVKWASYSVAYGGTATLYRSGSAYLDNDNRTRTLTAELPPSDPCTVWIILGTDIPVPTTVTLQQRQGTQTSAGPFWDSQINQGVGHIIDDAGYCFAKNPPPTP